MVYTGAILRESPISTVGIPMNSIRSLYCILLSLSLTFACIPACDLESGERGSRNYSSKATGVKLNLPAGWEVRENYQGANLFAFAPKDDPKDQFHENINVMIYPDLKKETLQQFFEREYMPHQLEARYNDYELLDVTDKSLSAGIAKRVVHKHVGAKSKQYRPLKQITYFLVTRNTGYIITCTAEEKRFSKYQPTFDRICANFKP